MGKCGNGLAGFEGPDSKSEIHTPRPDPKLKGPPPFDGSPAQQEVLQTSSPLKQPERLPLRHCSPASGKQKLATHGRKSEFVDLSSALVNFFVRAYLARLPRLASLNSRYVYGVSCRVRAKSYPSEPSQTLIHP
jgi:hypothetical protein